MINTHNIKIAKKKDIKSIMNFIKKHWDKNHILGSNYNFFCYEFLEKKFVNFVLAFNKKNKKIDALQGFIRYEKKEKAHICGSIACVSKQSKRPFLGLDVMRKMLEITKPTTYCGIGTNPKTMLPLVKKYFNRSVGLMDHFYILNYEKKKFKICRIPKKKILKKKIKFNNYLVLKKINNFQFLKENFNFKKNFKNFPKKSPFYLKKRYFEHPIYNYLCFGVFNNKNKILSFLITRELIYKKSKILRIIDFRGNPKNLGEISFELIRILKENDYEYIDMLCSGIKEKYLNFSSFIKKDNNDEIIIPNYFDPFVKKNIKIFYEKSDKNLILFKGDADADRPRLSIN